MYFIQAENGPIKIGYACDPIDRLRDLQVGNPYKLTLRCVVSGGIPEERRFQTLFGAARMMGEWFHPTEELVALIETGGKWTIDVEHRYLRLTGHTVPGEYESYQDSPLCRQCGINLRATEPGVDEFDTRETTDFPELCGACREFAGLRAAGVDPFADQDAA